MCFAEIVITEIIAYFCSVEAALFCRLPSGLVGGRGDLPGGAGRGAQVGRVVGPKGMSGGTVKVRVLKQEDKCMQDLLFLSMK